MLTAPLELCIAVTAVICGAALQSLSGIGMAVIAAPILVLIEPAFLPAPILALGCTLCILNTLRNGHSLNAGNIRLALYGRLPGSLLGIPMLAVLPQQILMIGFALLISFSVVLSYRRFRLQQTRCNLLIAGFFSGLMGTTTSVGGPAIALVYQNSAPEQVRAELGFYFLVGTMMSLSLLWFSDQISRQQVVLTLQMLPAVTAGFIVSIWLDRYFRSDYLKPIIALLSLSSSALILWRATFQM